MLPNLRPNTEDFLTFLCFRGTNSLPRELDFENTHNQASTSGGNSKAGNASPDKRSKEAKSDSKGKKNSARKSETLATATTTSVNSKAQRPNNISESSKDPKTGFMPFAVRKRAEVHPVKNDKKKLQSVAKKAQNSKPESTSSKSRELQSGARTTRSNPAEEEKCSTPVMDTKKSNKRKTLPAESSLDNSQSQASCSKTPKLEKTAASNNSKNFNESGSNQSKEVAKRKNNQKSDQKRETRLSSNRRSSPAVVVPAQKSRKKESSESDDDSSDDDNEPLIKKQSFKLKETNEPLKKKLSEPEALAKTEKPSETKKVERKKKTNVDLEIANSQTDLSENETRGRPMRKTKEAATIYMELIGRKLTLQDSSDNDSSLDSLEVPNLKRVELMEIEMRANCDKAKEVEAEKKRNDNKKSTASEAKSLKLNHSNSKQKEEQSSSAAANLNSLEKSFNDSDEEPLATKISKPVVKTPPKKRGRKSNQELAEIRALQNAEQAKKEIPAQITEKKSVEPQVETVVEKKTKLDASNVSGKANLTTKAPAPTTTQPKLEAVVQIDDDEFVKGFDTAVTRPVATLKTSINLLPSKEESEKIFGIASVTLAQSCGPLDTKCTLGKCGSVHVHKPPLGPTVLTESALGASLSPKDRRKSKVNMTRDQIQKWLEEASWTPIPDELETIEPKATSKASTSSFGLSKSGDDSQSSSLLKEKVIDLPSPSTSGKDYAPKSKLLKSESQVTTKFMAKVDKTIEFNFPLKTEEPSKQASRKSGLLNTQKASRSQASPTLAASSPANCSSPEKKTPIYQQQHQVQQRRTPVYKTENVASSKLTPVLPKSFGAFSPENEHSVYSFDREDDNLPISSTPFRRSNSKAESDTFHKPAVSSSKNKKQPTHVSLTLSPEENKKSASMGVEMTEDSKKAEEKVESAKEDKEKDAENDSDSEGHTFYIPLQASNASGSKTIQGVAVKLGTEGAEGPNQRIIMHAKLVTKSRANAAPLPDSMTNVQELVKTLMAGKETPKPVPCATVQPRFKSYDGAAESALQPEPSTSSLVANQRSKQQPKLGKSQRQVKILFTQTNSNCSFRKPHGSADFSSNRERVRRSHRVHRTHHADCIAVRHLPNHTARQLQAGVPRERRDAVHGVQSVRSQDAASLGPELEGILRDQKVFSYAKYCVSTSSTDRRHRGGSAAALSHGSRARRAEGSHREEEMGQGGRGHVHSQDGARSCHEARRYLLQVFVTIRHAVAR